MVGNDGISSLNDEGVYVLQHGTFRQAISVFHNALKGLLSQINAGGSDDAEPPSPSEKFRPYPPLVECLSLEQVVSSPSYQENSTIFIFDQALVFHLSDDDSDRCQNLASAALLYNIALSHHMMGVTSGVNDISLHQALRFYKMALAVCMSKSFSSISTVQLAIVNNMAAIHSALMEPREAETCMRHLSSLLVKHTGEDVRDSYSIFYLNLLVQGSSMTLAPAA